MKKIFEKSKRLFQRAYKRFWELKRLQAKQSKQAKKLKAKEQISVVFMAMTISMWKYQKVYELFKADSRFKTVIVLSPCMGYSKEQQMRDVKNMRTFFNNLKIEYIDWDFEKDSPPFDVRAKINPDILFYQQPYTGCHIAAHDFSNFEDKLLCHSPYAYVLTPNPVIYNRRFHNIAWKLFYQNKYTKAAAKKLAWNGGQNVRVVGYTSADEYFHSAKQDVWKRGNFRKRVIWAPHFTLKNDGSPFSRSNFLWMADLMKRISENYKEIIQFAFKPHPRLRTELYNHSDWGKGRTDEYYNYWANSANTQIEEGDFINLFYYSDAMIHDSGSFSADYLYFNKPVMYISQDIAQTKRNVDTFGKMVYDVHYIGKIEGEVYSFIENVVLQEKDRLKPQRDAFFEHYLLPGKEHSASEAIYREVLSSIGF